MKYSNILLTAAAIPVALLLTSCSHNAQPPGAGRQDVPVTVVIAKPSQGTSDGVTATGQVEAVHSAPISTRLMGTITNIYVKVGDKVRKGQLLAVISAEEIAARRAQTNARIAGARADLDNARKDFDRYTALFNKQSATASELDNATVRYNGAKARLESMEQMGREIDASGAYAHLTAPFAGVVTQKAADAGSLAVPGTPILVIEQNDLLQVNATIAESDISRIRTGDTAEMEISATGLRPVGRITRISVSSVATGGQYQVKIDLPGNMQKGLYAGMYVNVFIPGKSRSGTTAGGGTVLIPAAALVEMDQLTGIYTVSNTHTALLRWIRIGKKVGDKVEVLSGLNADESFISGSSGKLYNGAPVIEK